jgi:transposase InsO family protein
LPFWGSIGAFEPRLLSTPTVALLFTIGRLMNGIGLQSVIHGKPIQTTGQNAVALCPLDRVNRVFHATAPNILGLSDLTHVSTWSGFVYVAFVIDACRRRSVGWRVSRTAHAGFVLDALEQTFLKRRPVQGSGPAAPQRPRPAICQHQLS